VLSTDRLEFVVKFLHIEVHFNLEPASELGLDLLQTTETLELAGHHDSNLVRE
jgi:hypothetical protein